MDAEKIFHVPATPSEPKVLVAWFHTLNAQEIVLRAITSYGHSIAKERLLLREITYSINNKCASVKQADKCYGEASVFPLPPNRRSYERMGSYVFGTFASFVARGRVLRTLFTTALLGTSLAPTLGAELISPLDGFQTALERVAVSIYYEPTHAEHRVVITAGTEEPGSVIRFVSNLAPGQGVVVSVPRGAGQPARELYLHRVGNQLELERSSNND